MRADSPEAKHLVAFIERIERLLEDKKQVSDDIKEVYAEAKGTGYDVKILRKVIAIRGQDKDKRRKEEEILDMYLNALGMTSSEPFGPGSGREFGVLGKARPLSEADRKAGVTAAFVDCDGMRSTLTVKTDTSSTRQGAAHQMRDGAA